MFKGKKLRLLSLCLYEEYYIIACISLLFKISVAWSLIKVPKRQLGEHSVKHPAPLSGYENNGARQLERTIENLALAVAGMDAPAVPVGQDLFIISGCQIPSWAPSDGGEGAGLSSIIWKCLASASVI